MYSGITSGRVLNGELLYTKILEVNLFAFANKLTSRIFVDIQNRNVCLFVCCFVCPPMVNEKTGPNGLKSGTKG